jgi:hypothetical protein
MNKYMLADMVTEKLTREIGMVTKPFPEELSILEAELAPAGRVCFESRLYQTEKLKKISITKHDHGEGGAGTLVVMAADDKYDLPFIVVDIAFDFGEKGKIITEFEAKPLVKDEESTRKYINPFQKWREALGELPSETKTIFGEVGEFLKSNMSPNEYVRFIPDAYSDAVLKFAEQFLDIFLDIYRKAEPVKDVERKRKINAFRSEYNKHVLDEDPTGVFLINTFGRKKAQLFYEHLINL